MFWNVCLSSWVFLLRFLVFEIWSTVYSTFVVSLSETQTNSEKKNYVRGWSGEVPSSLRMLNTKSTISQKLKIAKKNQELKIHSEHCVSFETIFFSVYWHRLGDYFWKTRNCKIDFSFFSENCPLFWYKKRKTALFEGGEVYVSLTRIES